MNIIQGGNGYLPPKKGKGKLSFFVVMENGQFLPMVLPTSSQS